MAMSEMDYMSGGSNVIFDSAPSSDFATKIPNGKVTCGFKPTKIMVTRAGQYDVRSDYWDSSNPTKYTRIMTYNGGNYYEENQDFSTSMISSVVNDGFTLNNTTMTTSYGLVYCAEG